MTFLRQLPEHHLPVLIAGISYTLQRCAIRGSTGKSDWSDPVSKMSM